MNREARTGLAIVGKKSVCLCQGTLGLVIEAFGFAAKTKSLVDSTLGALNSLKNLCILVAGGLRAFIQGCGVFGLRGQFRLGMGQHALASDRHGRIETLGNCGERLPFFHCLCNLRVPEALLFFQASNISAPECFFFLQVC